MATASDNEDLFGKQVREALAGKYRVERVLGRGGMAVVFEATEIELDRRVALKVLPMEHAHTDELVGRFKQEAQLAARLHHPHIIPIYRVGSEERIHFISMAYMEGGTLEQRIQQGINLKDAVSVIRQVADALDFAHKKRLIHRDIKPANIMFDVHDTAFVLDFGIAKAVANTMITATRSFFGTPHYMSPEQVVEDKVDGRTDLYALGVIFFQMVTGSLPFDGDEALSIMYKHVNHELPPLVTGEGPVDANVAAIIQRMLAKNREQRYQTGAEIVADLDGLTLGSLTDHAVAASPQPPSSHTIPMRARNTQPIRRRAQGQPSARRFLLPLLLLTLAAAAGLIWFTSRGPEPQAPEEVQPPVNQAAAEPEFLDELATGGRWHREEDPLATSSAPQTRAEPETAPPREPVPQKSPARKPTASPPASNPNAARRQKIAALLQVASLVKIRGGSFQMGSDKAFKSDEHPPRTVSVSPFQVSRTEVNQELWNAVMDQNPSCKKGDNLPVHNVSWLEANQFIEALNQILDSSYRLPTEAEWEYLCSTGQTGAPLKSEAWIAGESGNVVHPVASRAADANGLFDLRGNTWEWCSDWYGKRYYKSAPAADPTGPPEGSARVLRGGGWDARDNDCRCANRNSMAPAEKNCATGFRLVLSQ